MNKRTIWIIGVIAVVLIALLVVLLATHKKAGDSPTAKTSSTSASTSGSESPSSSGAANSDSESIDNSGNTGSPVATTAVAIQNFAFSPTSITVKVGDTVTWTNKDSTAHTVTADSPSDDAPASGSVAPNATYSFTFKKAGTYSYHCDFHPNMKATVTVTD